VTFAPEHEGPGKVTVSPTPFLAGSAHASPTVASGDSSSPVPGLPFRGPSRQHARIAVRVPRTGEGGGADRAGQAERGRIKAPVHPDHRPFRVSGVEFVGCRPGSARS